MLVYYSNWDENSGGRPVASNIELRFSRIKNINQFGYHTVNLSFQLDDHRPATSIMDAEFEMSSLIAKENYVMPAGFAPVRVDVADGAPRPWLELQAIVTGKHF